MCADRTCPDAEASNAWTAPVVADHLEQGWARLCNGVILFDDGFFLAPGGRVGSVRSVRSVGSVGSVAA